MSNAEAQAADSLATAAASTAAAAAAATVAAAETLAVAARTAAELVKNTHGTNDLVSDTLVRIDRRTERIEQALFTGNGTPSVLERLSTLEERTPHRRDTAVWGAVGTFIGALIAAATSVGLGMHR